NIFGLFLALTLCLSAFSQPPAGGGRMGGNTPTGRIYGKVVDALSGKPVEFASVQLIGSRMDTVTHKPVEAVIGGMLTRSNGDFSIENVPVFGPIQIKVTGIGY